MRCGGVLFLTFGTVAVATALSPEDSLPDVELLMGGADASVKQFHVQAGFMRQAALDKHAVTRQQLTNRKRGLERNLSALDTRIASVSEKNGLLKACISNLTNVTKEMATSAKNWHTANNFLRDAMGALLKKMSAVRDFILETLNSTDVNGAEEIAILRNPVIAAPSLEGFLSAFGVNGATESDREDEDVSLLATDGERHRSNRLTELIADRPTASSVVPELTKRLQDIETAKLDGESELLGNFIVLHELGTRRLEAAQEEGKELMAKVEQLASLEDRLQTKISKMKATHDDLRRRLDSIRMFAHNSNKQTLQAAQNATMILQTGKKHAAAAQAAKSTTSSTANKNL